MPSFDVVSEVDLQEVDNAVNQLRKEIATRYDFKGSKSTVEHENTKITLMADDAMQLKAMVDILRQKMSKRGINPRSLDFKAPEKASGDMSRQSVDIIQGIAQDKAKKIIKLIKDKKLKKIQAQMQGDQIRITGPKRDDLQSTMKILEEEVEDVALQFTNFRD
jgi:uncharacterized protein YajQ (UPF0234 family)